MRDSVDAHVQRWAGELPWLDPIQEAIIARLAIVARHAKSSRQDLLDADGMRRWQFKILLMLRRAGAPYTASPSELAEWLGLTRGALLAPLTDRERRTLATLLRKLVAGIENG